ncbi:Hypothetical predicted protein, partial [Pelobates cultripes]
MPAPQEGQELATKQDIKKFLLDIKQMLTADIAMVKEDVKVVMDSVHASKEDILELRGSLSHLQDPLRK